MTNLIEQYKELCNDSRHYDQKLWLIPSAAYTVSALFYSVIFDLSRNLDVRLLLSLVNTLIFSGFLLQYVKDRTFQLEIQNAINKAQEQMPDMVKVSQYSGMISTHPEDRWFIKRYRQTSAANYIFYIMLLTLLVQLGISVVLILQWR